MAGGKYTTMNKVIPGAYFSIKGEVAVQSSLTPNGILAWIAPRNWGEDVVVLNLDEYNRDRCFQLLGIHNTDSYMQIFSQYCRNLICINPSVGRRTASKYIVEPQEESGVTLYLGVGIKPAKQAVLLANTTYELKAERNPAVDGILDISIVNSTDSSEVMKESMRLKDFVDGLSKTFQVKVYKKDSAGVFVEDYHSTEYKNITGSADEMFQTLSAGMILPSDASGSLQAGSMIGGLKVVAQHPGSMGNDLSLVVVSTADGRREVRTTLNGVVVDRQRGLTWENIKDNDYVKFVGGKSDVPQLSAAINLEGGYDGINSADPVISSDIVAGNGDHVHYKALTTSDDNIDADGLSAVVEGSKLVFKRGDAVLGEIELSASKLPGAINTVLDDGTRLTLILVGTDGLPYAGDVTSTGISFTINGGNHGVMAGIGNAREILANTYFNVVVAENQSELVSEALVDFVQSLGDESGKYRKAVCVGRVRGPIECPFNTDYVSVLPQAMGGDEALTAFAFAAMSAGATWNMSNAYSPIPVAGDPDITYTDPELEDYIKAGFTCISMREDGLWCVTKDCCSLHDLPEGYPEILKQNRAGRVLDVLRNSAKLAWETQYAGQVTNDENGRMLWKGTFCSILSALVDTNGIKPYDTNDVIVMEGNKPNEVITQCAFSIYDSMEIVYIQLQF